MTNKLEDFVESWFFDYFCKAKDCRSRSEFINRVWGLYNCENNADLDTCLNTASAAGINIDHFRFKVQAWLSDYASDVVFALYADGDLPEKYAKIYESEM